MKALVTVVSALVISQAFWGCSVEDADYKSGMYWLNERGNWQAAVTAFKRSLVVHPDRWKTHLALIEAMSQGDDADALERSLIETLSKFPDSSRSVSLSNAAITLMGEDRYTLLAGRLELTALMEKINRKGDKPELLSRAIIAACRARNQAEANALLVRLLNATNGELSDSVRHELNFFIGAAQLSKVELSTKLALRGTDPAIHLELANTALLSWDMTATKNELTWLAKNSPGSLEDPSIAQRFAALYGIQPYTTQRLTAGWDGSRSGSGSTVFIRERGTKADPDPYFYLSGDVAVLKAQQQNLRALSSPKFSRDGQWIYFYASKERNWSIGEIGKFNLYRMKPVYGSVPVKLTDDDLLPIEPYLLPGGSALFVRRDRGSVRQSVEVMKVDPEGRNTTSVVRIGEPVQWGAFTPGGDTLVFITHRGVFKRALTGGAATLELAVQGLKMPSISADGRLMLAHGANNDQVLFERGTDRYVYLGKTPFPGATFESNGSVTVTRGTRSDPEVISIDLNSKFAGGAQLVDAVKQTR
jgi:hypothetical protein